MTLTVNGEMREVPDGTTAAGLAAMFRAERGSAIAVDGLVVPRGEWPTYVFRDGQTVELVTAVQGG